MGSSPVIITPSNWKEALSLGSYFDMSKPLAVDVGCGKGRFLVAHARANPGWNFLGIDRLPKRLETVAGKVESGGLENVKLLWIEASYAASSLLPPLSVSKYFFFFPDPWPKRRHSERRLFAGKFIDSIDRTLIKGGCLYVATDDTNYFSQITKLFRGDARFAETEPFSPTEEERTSFELLFMKQGARIGRAGFQKK